MSDSDEEQSYIKNGQNCKGIVNTILQYATLSDDDKKLADEVRDSNNPKTQFNGFPAFMKKATFRVADAQQCETFIMSVSYGCHRLLRNIHVECFDESLDNQIRARFEKLDKSQKERSDGLKADYTALDQKIRALEQKVRAIPGLILKNNVIKVRCRRMDDNGRMSDEWTSTPAGIKANVPQGRRSIMGLSFRS